MRSNDGRLVDLATRRPPDSVTTNSGRSIEVMARSSYSGLIIVWMRGVRLGMGSS